MLPDDIVKQIPTDPAVSKRWWDDNYKSIVVSPKLILNGVTKHQRLRRFVDLPKLFDLLKNERLVLPRLRQLMERDPFECFARKRFDHLDRPELETYAKKLEYLAPDSAKKYFCPPPSLGENIWSNLSKGEPLFDRQIHQMTLEDLKEAVWYLERERLKNHLVCSCWYKGAFESDAMWKIYASQLGVSISSSAARMESAMKLEIPKILVNRTEFKLAAVQYDNPKVCQNQEPWLIKRKAFTHEKEVRLFCDVPFIFGPQLEIQINIAKLIEEIVITPFAAAWQVAGIKGAIEALLKEVGARRVIVRQSRHMRVPEFGWPPDTKAQNEVITNAIERNTLARALIGRPAD